MEGFDKAIILIKPFKHQASINLYLFDLAKVEYISPDTILEKTQEGDKYYFRVLIVLDKTELVSKDHKKIELTPGMTAQIDIITGNRSVLTYLTKPIIKTFSEAFHER